MSSIFNITEWVLKNTIKEGSKKTIYDFIEHVVENWPVSLNEKYGKDFFNTLKARFKGQVSGLGDSYGKISDEDIERYIELFDKNKDKGTFGNNKDINAYTLPELIAAVNRFDDQDAIKSVEQVTTPADEVYKDEEKDIIIWYGHQDNCIRQGADQPISGGTRWCITQPGGSYWGRYRYGKDYDYPTFYLIRNGQLPKGEPQTPQTPQVPRAPTGPTTTTRTPFRLPKIPPAALRLLGRANAVAGAALLGWELGTAIDQYLHPPGPKAPPRPFNQQDVLPSPESLYPSPSNAAGGGGGGGGGGLGGGMGGSGR